MRRSLSVLALFIAVLLPLKIWAAPGVQAKPAPDLLSAELEAALKAVTPEAYNGVDSVVVWDETRVEVEPSGLSQVFKYQVVKVLTEKGCSERSVWRVDYDPASSLAEVREATLIRADGTHLSLSLSGVRDLPQPQYAIYWGPRMKLVPFSGLEPGDAIALRTWSKGFTIAYLDAPPEDERYVPPMRGHFYDQILFQGSEPIYHKAYTVVLPKDKPLRAEVFNGELSSSNSFDAEHLIYAWWKDKVPALEREMGMVEDSDVVPKLVLATVPDWPEKSRWFFEVNEKANAFAFNPEIEAKVKEITQGHKTDDEKRQALLAWVARQIRYSGISMGKGEGYTLHPGIMTFNDRAGVCKDIAGMLVTMFRAAGYTAYPTLTMAGSRVEDIPADQFNHCVVAVKNADGTFQLYDPTWCPYSSETWSNAERPQHYVMGTPEGASLQQTTEASASENLLKIVSSATLDKNGNLKGTLTFTGRGNAETGLRRTRVRLSDPSFRAMLQEQLLRLSPLATLTSMETTDPADVFHPFRLTLTYEIRDYAMVSGEKLLVTPVVARNMLGRGRTMYPLTAGQLPTRTHDLFLSSSLEVEMEETLTLPASYRLEHSPKVEQVKGEIASFDASYSLKGRQLLFQERFTISRKIVPAEAQPELHRATQALEALSSAIVVLER